MSLLPMDVQLRYWRVVGQNLSDRYSSDAFHNHSARDDFGESQCPGSYIRHKSEKTRTTSAGGQVRTQRGVTKTNIDYFNVYFFIFLKENFFFLRRIILLLPELALNVLGTIWTYTNCIQCDNEHFTNTVVESK